MERIAGVVVCLKPGAKLSKEERKALKEFIRFRIKRKRSDKKKKETR